MSIGQFSIPVWNGEQEERDQPKEGLCNLQGELREDIEDLVFTGLEKTKKKKENKETEKQNSKK